LALGLEGFAVVVIAVEGLAPVAVPAADAFGSTGADRRVEADGLAVRVVLALGFAAAGAVPAGLRRAFLAIG
jgi:hypothetical protein